MIDTVTGIEDAAPDGVVARELKSWDVVAFVGLLTFVTTMAYEFGRAAFWGIPPELVRFSSENAFLTFIRLALASLIGGLVFQLAREWKWYRVLVSVLVVLLTVLGIVRVREVWGGLAPIGLFVGAAYALAATFALSEDPPTGWSRQLLRMLGRGGTALSVALIAVPYAAMAIGYFMASDQKSFLVTTGAPRRVVLATYGSDAVAAVLEGDAKTGYSIRREFEVLALSDDKVGGIAAQSLERIEVKDR